MKYPFRALPVILLCTLCLCGCRQTEPAVQTTQAPAVEQVSMVVTELTLANFDADYPDLKEADFTGSTCYRAIEDYKLRNPQVAVHYTVDLGGTSVEPDVTALELHEGMFTYAVLHRNLQYLPSVRQVTFSDTAMLAASIHELEAAYPGIEFVYSVEFCGISCDGTTEELDLSAANPEEVIMNASQLSAMKNVKTLRLSGEDGASTFSLEQAARLQQAVPDVFLDYSFELFGQQLTTLDEEVIYHGMNLAGREGSLDAIRQALTVMTKCQRFVLDSCLFKDDVMAALREEFRGKTKVVWRIWYGQGSILTDRTIIRHVYDLYDWNSETLKYCEDAEFIDFGHNGNLSNCSYVANMPKLRAIILSGSMIRDLTPFANCESLEFLEIAYCSYINDLSPLSNCKNLKRLNIAYTGIDSLTALDNQALDVLVTAKSKIPLEECERYAALYPDCIQQRTGDVKDDLPYSYPWRYDRNGDPNEYYALLMEKFHYPNTFNTLY